MVSEAMREAKRICKSPRVNFSHYTDSAGLRLGDVNFLDIFDLFCTVHRLADAQISFQHAELGLHVSKAEKVRSRQEDFRN